MENLETRLNEVARIAVGLEQETGCPAQLMIAQWAIESAWGAKPVGHANYFGIKKADRHTKCCTVTTREVINGKSVVESLEFADYDSLEEPCRDYSWLITQGAPYRAAWQGYQIEHDFDALAGGCIHICDGPQLRALSREHCVAAEHRTSDWLRAPGGRGQFCR